MRGGDARMGAGRALRCGVVVGKSMWWRAAAFVVGGGAMVGKAHKWMLKEDGSERAVEL